MTNCPVCGKRFVVCWPDLWPYRRRSKLFCMEACLVVYIGQEFRDRVQWMEDHRRRKKEEEKVGKITLEQKKKAVSIAISGGDPMKFLKECGSKNPSAHWYYIKKTLKEKNKVLYDKIPDRFLDKAQEQPKVDLTISTEELSSFEDHEDEDVNMIQEDRESAAEIASNKPDDRAELPEDVIKAINEPWRTMRSDEPDRPHEVDLDDDFEIYGLKTKAGDFQSAAGNLCWTFDGFQMNLPVDRWRKLIETVPKVLKVMKL